jgi:hypothetical protein
MEMKREAVSESIGFLIIFGLILTGIGLITLYGYPLLMQQQSSANVRNMEQTMVVLQNDIKSLAYKLANFKETSLRVSGGSLSLVGPMYTLQRFDIWTDDGGIGGMGGSTPYRLYPGELRYFSTNDNLVITMENGAVIEKPLGTNGSFMLADPRWYLDKNTGTLVINLMNISSGAGTGQLLSQTGVGTVRMRLLNSNVTTYSLPVGWTTTVNIRYTPDPKNATPEGYGFAWKAYLTNANNFDGGMTCTGEPLKGEPLWCVKPTIRNIIIKEYNVVVESL